MLLNCGVGEDSWERVPWTARRSKGNPLWMFIGRTDAEAETPILWPPGVKKWLIWKDPDVGKVLRQEEKGTTEHETVGWHHRLNRHEIEWTPGVRDGQGGLACCSPWGCKESDTTEQLNWTDWTELLPFIEHSHVSVALPSTGGPWTRQGWTVRVHSRADIFSKYILYYYILRLGESTDM